MKTERPLMPERAMMGQKRKQRARKWAERTRMKEPKLQNRPKKRNRGDGRVDRGMGGGMSS